MSPILNSPLQRVKATRSVQYKLESMVITAPLGHQINRLGPDSIEGVEGIFVYFTEKYPYFVQLTTPEGNILPSSKYDSGLRKIVTDTLANLLMKNSTSFLRATVDYIA